MVAKMNEAFGFSEKEERKREKPSVFIHSLYVYCTVLCVWIKYRILRVGFLLPSPQGN